MKNPEYPFSAMIPYEVEDSNPLTDIVYTVCRQFRVSPGLVYSKSREQGVAECRMVCMYFLRNRGLTLKSVGELMGRDHSGVYADLQALQRYKDTSPTLREMIQLLEQAV